MLFTRCTHLLCEFQVTPLTSWGISLRCGFLWIAGCIINRSVLSLESTEAHCLCVGFQKQLFAQVYPQANIKKQNKMKHAIIFARIAWNLPPLNTRKNEAFLPVLSYCQRGIWYPCCAWQFGAQVLVATGHVLCNPPQMKSSPFRQPTAHCAIH